MESRNSEQSPLSPWALRAIALVSVVVLIGAATPQGATASGNVQRFLSFYAGVFALVAMTGAVVSGLIATERSFLSIRHRVVAQAIHRASSLVTVTFLVAHILVKVLAQHATASQIVIPYAGPVGFGAIASDFMIIIVSTGLLRAKFARGGKPWVWRSMHALAYASWPIAIYHGLTAGRAPKGYVTVGYAIAMMIVGMAVVTRMMLVVKPRNAPRTVADPSMAPAPAQANSMQNEMRNVNRSEVMR